MSASEQQYEHPIARLKWLNENQANESWLHEQIDGSWVTLNCGEVYERALRVAAALHSQGLQHGDKVAILAKNSAQWMISDFALMLGGMISVPIYATAGQKTISYVLEHSGAKAIFVGKLDNTAAAEEALQDAVVIAYPESNIDSTFVKHTWNDLLAHEPLSDIANPGKEDIATLVYTSGSTGNPKGVVLSYNNLAAAAQGVLEVQPAAQQKHRVLSYLPMAHITERSVVAMVSLYELGDIFFNGDLNTFLADLQHAKPTNFVSVPRLWAKFKSQVLAVIPDEDLQTMLASDQGEAVAAGIREKLGTLDLPAPGSNRGYSAEEIIESFWLNVWTGASRYVHCNWLRGDAVIRDIFGFKQMPSQSTYSRFFGKFVDDIVVIEIPLPFYRARNG